MARLPKDSANVYVRGVTVFLRKLVFHVFSRAAVPRYKILVTFYQVVRVLPTMYDVEMPQEYCEPPPLCAISPVVSSY